MATSLIEPTDPDAIEIRKPMEYIRGTAAANGETSYPYIFEVGRQGASREVRSGTAGGKGFVAALTSTVQPPRPIMGRLFAPASKTVTRLMDAIENAVFKGLDK